MNGVIQKMKEINEYRKSATIYLVPNLRNGNSLKIEFRTLFGEVLDDGKAILNDIMDKLRSLGFSCSEAESHFNNTQNYNIIDISLDLCTDEKEIAQDLFVYLETVLGKDQVIDRTRSIIKKEISKMKV